jgi:hypothetical protein
MFNKTFNHHLIIHPNSNEDLFTIVNCLTKTGYQINKRVKIQLVGYLQLIFASHFVSIFLKRILSGKNVFYSEHESHGKLPFCRLAKILNRI